MRPTFFGKFLSNRFIVGLNNAFKKHPVICGVSLGAMEGMFADTFTQCILEKKKGDEFEMYRVKTFGVFNTFVYSMDYMMLNKLVPTMFSRVKSGIRIHPIGSVLAQSMMYVSLLGMYYFTPFYYIQQAIHSNDYSFDSFKIGWAHFKENYKNDMFSLLAVWVPAACVVFSATPKHLVLPFIVCVDICWLIGLSLYRGDITQFARDRKPKSMQCIELK
eukprot:156425_1